MSPPSFISVAEYLVTNYRPDCDYVDGEVQERNAGEQEHSLLQGLFATLFHNHWRAWQIVSLIAVRVQVSPTRIRVPDVCILRSSDPVTPIVKTAPLICIEILSSEDRFQRVQERVDDYVNMGVGYVWIINPKSRNTYIGSTNGFLKTSNDELIAEGTPICISLAEVFAEFDEIQGEAKA